MSDDTGTILPFPSVKFSFDGPQEENPNQVPAPALSEYEQFFAHMANLAQIGLATVKHKNQDYAGTGDPFANFKIVEAIGVSAPRGMLIRMMDKISRMSNLLQRPPAVTNESLQDTCIDLAMYALILATYIRMHPNAAD